MSHSYPLRPLAEVIGNGLVSDGDWIESKDQDANGDVRLIQLADIGDGRYLNKSNRFLTKETASRLKCTPLLAGDVLIARMPDPIGRACIFPGDAKEAITVVDVCILRVDQRTTDAAWLMNLINADFTRSAIEKAAGGTTRTRVSRGSLEKLLLPTPVLQEQHKIAAILTAVDDKLDVIARQIEATQTLKQGLIQTLFSRGVGTQDADDRWVPHTEFKDSELGKLPVGWEVAPLGELLEKLMDFRGRTPKKLGMDWGGGTIPALSANNVRAGYIDFDRECYLGSEELYAAWMVQGDTQKNDLVFTMEAPLGNVAVIPDDRKYILSQRVVLLRTNKRVNHSFLFQYLRSDTFGKILDSNATGTTAKGIQQKRLVQLSVVVPSLKEQAHIANVLDAIDSKLGALAAKQSHHQDLKRGLMQKLLTGQWRVKVDAELAA